MAKVRCVKLPVTCSDYRTGNADEGGSENPDVESQDEGDLGYGARPGGGFTSASAVSTYSNAESELNCILDKLKGYCTI